MSANNPHRARNLNFRLAAILALLLIPLSAWPAYTVHSVAGDVKLVAKNEKTRLKKGMALQPSDELELSKGAYVEIFNDLDNHIYRCEKPGRLSVMRLMLDARQSASDNRGNLGGHISIRGTGTPGQSVFTETGMVMRRFSTVDDMEPQSPVAPSQEMREKILTYVAELPQGKTSVGIAFVSDSDTITVNNAMRYPMMSVLGLHQALAVADRLARSGNNPDSTLYIPASDLDRNTWSPMLKKYGEDDFMISVDELARFAVTSSDNNASDLLFKRIVSPEETDRFIRAVAPDTTFRISRTEAQIRENHDLSYDNRTSPLSAALLIRKVFTDSVVTPAMQDSIKTWLSTATIGADRLGAPVMDKPEVLFAHKTSSGYLNPQGELIAHNDVGYFRLPDGRDYALAVLIRDFNGTEAKASAIIAEISRLIYTAFTKPISPLEYISSKSSPE